MARQARIGRSDREVHDRAALRESLGGLRAGFGERSLAHEVPGPRRGSRRRALAHRAGVRILPGAREGHAAREGGRHRQVGRGPRDPPGGDRRRRGHSRPGPPEGRDGRPRRPAQDDARGGREDHRDGAADLLLQRGTAFHRDRQPGDGHGAGLPPGGFEPADDRADPQERDRAHQPGVGAGRPRQGGRLVLPLPQGQDRLREPARDVAAVLGLLRLPRQQPRHAPEGAQAHAGRAPDVLRLPSDGRARPARVDPAAPHLERHRAPTTPTSTRS